MHKRFTGVPSIKFSEETSTTVTDVEDEPISRSSKSIRRRLFTDKWSIHKAVDMRKARRIAGTFIIFICVIKILSHQTINGPQLQHKDPLNGILNTNELSIDSSSDKEGRQARRGRGKNLKYKQQAPLQEINYGAAFEEGDKSEEYAQLRREYDALLSVTDISRMKHFVHSLKKNTYTTARPQDMPYDIYNCPEDPPENYPFAWNVLTILQNWEIDDPTPRKEIYQGLCVFDYERDYDKALTYRNAEVPFVVQNDPRVLRTAERWNQPYYLQKLLGDKNYKAEYSPSNHFMYWNPPDMEEVRHLNPGLRREVKNWKPPTEKINMSYLDWLEHVNTSHHVGPNSEHWYFRLIGCGIGSGRNCIRNLSEYLFDELDFFRVDRQRPKVDNAKRSTPSSMYIVDPSKQAGIHCRFGMRGVVAENHFDTTRNTIVVLGGERRYLLSHPNQSKNMELYPEGHPSARHSAVDWSKPDLDSYPKFQHALVNEVVLQAGDVLYLPTNWFHHIVSLELNYQCNTRSGRTTQYDHFLNDAGFNV